MSKKYAEAIECCRLLSEEFPWLRYRNHITKGEIFSVYFTRDDYRYSVSYRSDEDFVTVYENGTHRTLHYPKLSKIETHKLFLFIYAVIQAKDKECAANINTAETKQK